MDELVRVLTASGSRSSSSVLTPDVINSYLQPFLPDLTDAIVALCLNRPADPHQYLANYLLNHPNRKKRDEPSTGSSPSAEVLNLDSPAAASVRQPLRVIIAGAACSGKGTQCEYIKREYDLPHLSTGDLLRDAVKNGTEIGLKAKEYMEQGALVPDSLIVDLVKEKLDEKEYKEKGVLLDGFPRALSQAKELEKIGFYPDLVLSLEVEEGALLDRVTGRRLDPQTGAIYHLKYFPPPKDVLDSGRLVQRADDTEEKMRVRLKAHYGAIQDIESFYGDKIVKIDGNREKDKIFLDIQQHVNNVKKHKQKHHGHHHHH